MDTQPLKALGLALVAGVVFDKLFLPKAQVRRVAVPVPPPVRLQAQPTSRSAQGWFHAAGSGMQRLGRSGRDAASGAAGAAAVRVTGVKDQLQALAPILAQRASHLPLQLRLASERILARSQAYGHVARVGLQARPLVGVGAVFGIAALATTLVLVLQRRRAASDTAYITVDEKGHGIAWQHEPPEMTSSARRAVTSHPAASALVVFGLGALAGAMLRRH